MYAYEHNMWDMNADANSLNHSLLEHVADFYHRSQNKKFPAFLQKAGLSNWEILNHLGVGYSDGTMAEALSDDQRSALKEMRILGAKGREVLLGYMVVPLRTVEGRVGGFIGISLSGGVEKNVFVAPGLINYDVLSVYSDKVILTETVLDSLRLMTMGFPNSVPLTDSSMIVHAMKDARVKRVVLIVSSEKQEGLKQALLAAGTAVEVPRSPIDVGSLMNLPDAKARIETLLSDTASFEPTPQGNASIEHIQDRWTLRTDSMVIRVVGVKDTYATTLKVSARIELGEKKYQDSLDLLSARSRRSFAEQSAVALLSEAAVLERHLTQLMDAIEGDLEARSQVSTTATDISPLSEDEVKSGMSFLKNPDMFRELTNDLDSLGYVGEETNKRIAYLVATSRILPDPLNLLVVSSAAAGKSFLIETVRKLVPEQDVLSLTSLSEQALNYMGKDALVNKLLVLGEAVHSEAVQHSIREMISAKELSRMVVAKNERTGKMESRVERTKAIVSLMMSATSSEKVNDENLTRYLMIHADETEEQTRRIHRTQNRKYSLEHLQTRNETVPRILAKHHAAQRLLKPVHVVNPFWDKLEFPSLRVRSRRDNQQLNSLIVAIAFLKQHQRERKSVNGLDYIEATLQDYEEAKELFLTGILKQTYQEYPESLVRLFDAIRDLCRDKAKGYDLPPTSISFDINDLRQRVGFLGLESIQKYMRKLIELEYLGTQGSRHRGQRTLYRLIEDRSLVEMEGVDRKSQ
jgi:hypothetical protein